VLEADIAAASGSRENPLSDAQLEIKLEALAGRVGFSGDSAELAAALWRLEDFDDAGSVARLAAGAGRPRQAREDDHAEG
jgi:hypothetical protein